MSVLPFLFILSSVFARDLAVAHYGDAKDPQVLLIHGSPGSQDTWKNVAGATKNFRLIVPDRHGYGGSGKGHSELSLQVQAEDMSKLIAADAIVIGYSYGGAVAVKLALMYPEKVRALILVAPALNPELEKLKWWQSPAYIRFIRNALPSDARVSMEESIALPEQLRELDLSEIHVPVFYLQGKSDHTVSVKTADYVEKKFTGTHVHFTWLDNMDHDVPVKAPEVIARLIGEI